EDAAVERVAYRPLAAHEAQGETIAELFVQFARHRTLRAFTGPQMTARQPPQAGRERVRTGSTQQKRLVTVVEEHGQGEAGFREDGAGPAGPGSGKVVALAHQAATVAVGRHASYRARTSSAVTSGPIHWTG